MRHRGKWSPPRLISCFQLAGGLVNLWKKNDSSRLFNFCLHNLQTPLHSFVKQLKTPQAVQNQSLSPPLNHTKPPKNGFFPDSQNPSHTKAPSSSPLVARTALFACACAARPVARHGTIHRSQDRPAAASAQDLPSEPEVVLEEVGLTVRWTT